CRHSGHWPRCALFPGPALRENAAHGAVRRRNHWMETAMSQTLRVVMAQLNLRVGDVHGNVERLIEAAATARDQHQADVILFPELALCGYPPEDLLLRSSMQLRIEEGLRRLCAEVSGIHLVVGYPWLEDEKRYNAAAVIADGVLLATYYKQQLPNYRV